MTPLWAGHGPVVAEHTRPLRRLGVHAIAERVRIVTDVTSCLRSRLKSHLPISAAHPDWPTGGQAARLRENPPTAQIRGTLDSWRGRDRRSCWRSGASSIHTIGSQSSFHTASSGCGQRPHAVELNIPGAVQPFGRAVAHAFRWPQKPEVPTLAVPKVDRGVPVTACQRLDLTRLTLTGLSVNGDSVAAIR